MGQFVEMQFRNLRLAPEFTEFLCAVAVPSDSRVVFEADPAAWVFNAQSASRFAEKLWLDASAPGWRIEATRGQYHDLDTDEGDALFLDYQVTLYFAEPAHQAAWTGRLDALEEDAAALYFRIRQQIAQAPDGVEVCAECGGYMDQTEQTETTRIGQFALMCTAPELVCPDCGCREFLGPDEATMTETCTAVAARVGLPATGTALWTEELGAEWQRRADSVPDIAVSITPSMTPGDVLAALDAELAQRGRVFGRPRLVAVG